MQEVLLSTAESRMKVEPPAIASISCPPLSFVLIRFIPDDVVFDEEPKDAATDVNVVAYTPKLFTSSGTTTSKVRLIMSFV